MKTIKHTLAFLLALLALLCPAQELQPGDPNVIVLPDSSNFVTASLLVASPGQPIYSVFGHCALRMQCPAHHLDFVYSLEMDGTGMSIIRFFAGQNQAVMIGVPFNEYLSTYRKEGRSVTQYDLNLTHHEKQRLWQLLDEAMMQGPVYEFNMLNTNCVQMSMVMIERCLINEQFDAGKLPDAMMMNNGELMRYNSRYSPWAEFVYLAFLGSYTDGDEMLERKLSPATIVEVMQNANFVNDEGYRRPVLYGQPQQLLPVTKAITTSHFTPLVAFALLLAFVLLVTLLEWWRAWRILAKITDVALFITQTLVGILLAYTTIVSCLFGTNWNWYLIPFCPLAIVLWLVMRTHRRTLYLLFTVVLVAFLLMTPISSQIDLPHQLITSAFAVRTASNYFHARRG